MLEPQRISAISGDAGSEKTSSDSLSQAADYPVQKIKESRRQEGRIKSQKVAIVHDWLNGMRGGEIVFEAILDLFPEARVYTLIYEPDQLHPRLREKLKNRIVTPSWLNRFALTRRIYRHLLPLLPFAVARWDLFSFDLVVSSSHCVAKGVRKHPHAYHLSYVHAPMRYMWNKFEEYFGVGQVRRWVRWVARAVRPFLRAWDRRTSQVHRVDRLLANSQFIAEQIRRFYGREANVVYPFAQLERFSGPRRAGGFYLMVGAFAPYKKTDLAIRAFARLGLPLKIVGQGQDQEKLILLRQELGAQQVEFLGNPPNHQIEELYSTCKAFIFPGEEDFGITPLEAMASGAPVIAFGSGGACETVTPETGLLFWPQTIEALSEAVMEIESGRKRFDEQKCRERAAHFSRDRFVAEFLSQIPEKYLAATKKRG